MRSPLGVRTHFSCPALDCIWQIAWAFDGRSRDPDMGLVIGAHVEAKHPKMLYGDTMPTTVLDRVLTLAGVR